MKTLRRFLRHTTPAVGVATALLSSQPARAADVALYVQAPYELDSSLLVRFDLDRLHAQNAKPLYADRFEIPYEVIEPAIAKALADSIDGVSVIHVNCPTILCPDTDVHVTIVSKFAFTESNQPVVTTVGPASNNTLRIELDTQASVGLDVTVDTETGKWLSSNIPLGLHALVGIHAGVTLTLWPTLEAKDIEISLTHDGGTIDFGKATANGVAGPVISEGLVNLGVEAAQGQIETEINAAIAKELGATNERLTAVATALITPKLAAASSVRDDLMTTTIPKVGRSLEELMDLAGVSLDVRTRTSGSNVMTVVTTRFDPKPAGRQLQGTIRLPKTQCVYGPPVGSDLIGYTRLPEKVEAINDDLEGKACAAVISGSGVRRVAYLGESPDRHLQTGDPANVLPNWKTTGSVEGKGTVIDKGSYYECAYVVSALANASILELGIEPGSALAKRMPMQGLDPNVRARFLYATLGGVPLLLDAKGEPRNPAAVTFGRANPTTVEQCPTTKSDGKGLSLPKGFDVTQGLDPETCPTCGVLDLQRHTHARVRPGDVARFAHGFAMDDVLGRARAQTETALAAIPLQRVKQAGLKASRPTGRARKAAALPETHIHVRTDGNRR